MIKSLRKKFVLTNMILVFVILFSVFTVMCILTYRNQCDQNNLALERMLERPLYNEPAIKFKIDNRSSDNFVRHPEFIVVLDNNYNIIRLHAENISISADDLELLLSMVLNIPKQQGKLKKYDLRFMVKQEYQYKKIAFIDATNEKNVLYENIITSLIGIILALAGFFVVSLILAKISLKPVEKSWEQQKRFVGDASHELKTPLTIILANLNILKAHPADTIEQQMHWIDNTDFEAKRMKELVDNLLFLAKSDESNLPDQFEKINLSDLIFSTALSFESIAYERSLNFDVDIESDIHILGNLAKLQQVIVILLDNALKYTNVNGSIEISLNKVQNKAQIKVKNTGDIISDTDIPYIFDRFYRADESRSLKGYGLGLSIAKTIAVNHKGNLTVKSSESEGTRFYITFPLLNNTKSHD